MFTDFERVWTPVALGEELRAGKPFKAQVAGTPLVLFRDGEGRARALVDRCPHRGVALSLGKVKGGCIECPFHGWRLDGDGAVTHVPWNPDAKVENLRGIPIPTREVAGQVWIYTSTEAPDGEPQVHEALLAPGVRISGFSVVWKTHWTRAMENMLDWPHLPFVHKSTIGRSMQKPPSARMDVRVDPRPWGTHTTIAIDGREEPGSLDLRWPNQMNLHISSPPERLMMMIVACVPIDASSTKMMLTMARDFLTMRLFDPLFHLANARIASEDKAIVESSCPAIIPPAAEERSVRTDNATLYFRKRYFAELAPLPPGRVRKGSVELEVIPPA